MKIAQALFLFTTLLSTLSFAHHVENNVTVSEDNNLTNLEFLLHKGADFQKYLDIKVKKISTSIDNYFSRSEEFDYENSRSFIFLDMSTEYNYKESKFNDEINFRARLRLPKLSKKFHLFIENLNTEDEENVLDKKLIEDGSKNNNEYGGGFTYIFNPKRYFKISTGVGIKLNSNFEQYIKLKANKTVDLGEVWKTKFNQSFYLFSERKLESTTSLEFYRPIGEKYIFSNYNQYFWSKKTQIDSYHNSLNLHERLSEKDYLTYSAQVNYNDDQSNLQVKNYRTDITYTHKIRKWIYWQVTPAIDWSRTYDFNENYLLKFSLNMHAGNR